VRRSRSVRFRVLTAPGRFHDGKPRAGGGFSFFTDPTLPFTGDYGFVQATFDPFLVDHGNGQPIPATNAEFTRCRRRFSCLQAISDR